MKFSLTFVATLFLSSVIHADAVRLQIKGPNGQPVAGAKVRVVESLWSTLYDYSPSRDFVADAQGVVMFASKGALFKAKDPDYRTKSALAARVVAPGLAVKILSLKAGNNTLTLAKGQTIEGVTLDANSKPISGVSLAMSPLSEGNDYNWTPDILKLETHSDAQGHWKIAGAPLTGTASVQVKNSHFKNETFPLDLKQKAPPFFLDEGAGLKGRLLRPDGTPAKGIRIWADGYGYGSGSSIVTDANGRFQVMGITRPRIYLQLPNNSQTLSFVALPRMITSLQVGKVRNIGDWKTILAVNVSGKLVDAQTRQPIANAQINGRFGNIWRDVTSDDKGTFTIPTVPGAFNLTIRASGFAKVAKRGKAIDKQGADVGVIALQKGRTVTGVAVDQSGKPVSTYFYVSQVGDQDYVSTNEKDGKFTINALAPGKYTLRSYGTKIISGATFVIGKGALPKLRVVIAKNQAKSTSGIVKQRQVVGRVTDGDGNPVAGAKISMAFRSDWGGSRSLAIVSQSDGTFKTRDSISSQPNAMGVISRVARPGYVRASEQIELKEDGWHVALTLQKSGQVLRGRVVNSQGQGVAGAYIGLQNGDDLPSTTDASGNFSLRDAPQWGVTLLTSNGPSLATFQVEKGGKPIEIVLPDAPNTNKEELADKILPNAALEYSWGDSWDILGSKRIESLVLKGTGERGGSDWFWVQYLETLAHREPKTFLARESELQATTNVTGQEGFQRLKMLAQAKAGDAAQKAEVRAWLSEEEKRRLDLSMPSVLQLLSVAEVAAQLDPKQGAMWLEYADQVMGQLDFKRGGDSVWTLGRLTARVSPSAPQKIGQDWTPAGQMEILTIAMQTWSEDNNLKAAQAGWNRLNALSAQMLKHPGPKNRRDRDIVSYSLRQAQGSYVLLLAKNDPKSALALVMAPKNTDYRKRNYLFAIARLAIRAKQSEVAKAAIKALNATPQGGSVSTSEVAEITQEFDPVLAGTLWSREFSKGRSDFVEEWQQRNTSDVAYARTRARKWPGESRILLEREWQKRFQALPKKKTPQRDYYYEYSANPLSSVIEAMARVSPQRALELVDALPQSDNYKARVRLRVMLVLLQPDNYSSTRPYDMNF